MDGWLMYMKKAALLHEQRSLWVSSIFYFCSGLIIETVI